MILTGRKTSRRGPRGYLGCNDEGCTLQEALESLGVGGLGDLRKPDLTGFLCLMSHACPRPHPIQPYNARYRSEN